MDGPRRIRRFITTSRFQTMISPCRTVVADIYSSYPLAYKSVMVSGSRKDSCPHRDSIPVMIDISY